MTEHRAKKMGRRLLPLGVMSVLTVLIAPVAVGQEEPSAEESSASMAEREDTIGAAEPEPEAEPAETIPVEQSAPAPATDDPTVLDEVTVTAQKTSRAQLIKDVPISISVIDEKFIASWGITDVREAMLFVPNVRVEASGFFFSPRVRGFSVNNNNKAFEPPAGFALDGIPYTRVEYFNAAVFDIDRIEAMRGPQGTTFGKNTTAGLIHVISKNPSKEWTSYIDLQGGDFDRRRVEGALSGPLVPDFLNFRVAALYDDREGFIENTTAAVSVADVADFARAQHREGIRAKLQFPDLLTTSTLLTYETVDLDSIGVGAELFDITDRVRAALVRYDPNVDTTRYNHIGSVDSPDGRSVAIDTWSAESAFALGAWRMVGIAGFSEMKNVLNVDADFTPAPALSLNDTDRSPTTTFELRAEPPDFGGLFGLQELFGFDLGYTTVLVGAFYQHREIRDGGFIFKLGQQAFLELTVAAEEDDAAADLVNLVPQSVQNSLFAADPVNGPGEFRNNEESHQRFDQWSDAMALFTQVQWNFHPDWFFQLGLRASEEDKRAVWDSRYTSETRPVLLQGAGIEQFHAEREKSESEVQPKLSLNWKPFDSLSLFAHWARAYKGGGFNSFAYRPIDEQLVYEPELASDWGLDAKGSLFGGSAQYNISLYRLDIDNFQVLTNEPDPLVLGLGVTKVENAAKARAQGVEADFTWKATSWLTFLGTAAVNDTEYLDFKINACPADQDGASGAGTRDADPGDRRCDATGMPFPYTPRYNYTLFTNMSFPITDGGMMLNFGGGAEYYSMQFLDTDLDVRKVQEPFYRYRANIGLAHPRQRWSFKVVGENLSDVATGFRDNDLAAGVFYELTEPPRTIYGQFRYDFF